MDQNHFDRSVVEENLQTQKWPPDTLLSPCSSSFALCLNMVPIIEPELLDVSHLVPLGKLSFDVRGVPSNWYRLIRRLIKGVKILSFTIFSKNPEDINKRTHILLTEIKKVKTNFCKRRELLFLRVFCDKKSSQLKSNN